MSRIICTFLVLSTAACSTKSRGSWESTRSAYCDHLDNLRGDADFELGVILDSAKKSPKEPLIRISCMLETSELRALQNKIAGFVLGSNAVAAGRPEEMSPEYAGFDLTALRDAAVGEPLAVDVCEDTPTPEQITAFVTKRRAHLDAGFDKALARCRAIGWKPAR